MSSDGIGYGKPPKHSRFQPGQSGNPKGRPKGKASITQLIDKHFDVKISFMVGGQQKTMTRR